MRLNNTSQLAAFTKREDLPFFLRELCDADYLHDTRLAPTAGLLADYRKHGLSWQQYEDGFRALMAERQPEKLLDPASFAIPTVLLCSETTARALPPSPGAGAPAAALGRLADRASLGRGRADRRHPPDPHAAGTRT